MRSKQATLVKNQALSTAVNTTSSVVIDLGLAIGEAARILGIQGSISLSALTSADNESAVWISFDPDDTISASSDDEQFYHLGDGTQYLTSGGCPAILNDWVDYTNMNLITTRNLAMIVTSSGAAGSSEVKIFYEKFVPTANDLNALIAHRR